MPPHWKPVRQLWAEARQVGKQHVSEQIYNELLAYALDNQFYPVTMTLFHYMCDPHWNTATLELEPPRYPDITQSTFRWWVNRLVQEHLIEIDPEGSSRAVRCERLVIVERPDDSPDHSVARDIEQSILQKLNP